MSREVIQDFLNLAGVVGIALTNRRMRPYFYGLDAVLDRTKQALGQGVLQVVENIPEGFESFEFHFAGHIVFIYKLTHGLVLLVLTDSDLEPVDYKRGIAKIKYLIETDTYNTVAYFKLLLGSVTQHSLPSLNWNANNAKATDQAKIPEQPTVHNFATPVSNSNLKTDTPSSRSQKPDELRNLNNQQSNASSSKSPSFSVQTQPNVNNPSTIKPQTPPAPSPLPSIPKSTTTNSNQQQVNTSPTKQVSTKTDTQEYKLDELLDALNKLSLFTTQYLGKVVVTNYWKSSRPESVWLSEFEVDRNGKISYPKQPAIACNPEELKQIQTWVTAYIKRCKQVIRNFDQMLEQDCLDSRQKQILL
ncbi:hypothetical protein H6F42_12560 [Pseudanabaena sp. FACHB-1998]|uniref:hypothetical protein n=1 Tax=Pseudanabaena sp. FACHB-1998 TaxID=2692858 RepID=UPI001680E36A|nr:hypothetical protein [Pseudanabaena sp. FACHB-1998]MBD2177745.1 hypothetical protein [Pseudanabaena sp. FACHB-1998]